MAILHSIAQHTSNANVNITPSYSFLNFLVVSPDY
jgi:hypothetical protein